MFKKSDANPAGYSSGNADAGVHKYTNPEPAHPEPAPLRHVAPDKKGHPALLGASIRIKGELSGDEDLIIQGQVEGTIELKQNDLTVGAQGAIKANSRARIITVEGKLEGDLYGQERVVIKQSGDVRGNIVAPRVSLEDGAKFKGSIDMEPKAAKGNSVSLEARGADKSAETMAATSRHKDHSHTPGAHAKTA